MLCPFSFTVPRITHSKALIFTEPQNLQYISPGISSTWYQVIRVTDIIRPVAGQGSSPEMRFSFLKHFRILYPFIPNTIQINQRLCNNWHCKDLTQKNSKPVTLILRSCTGIWMVLHKVLDKALSSSHNWIKSIEGFAKKKKTEIVKHLSQNFYIRILSLWPPGLGMVPYIILDQFLSLCQTWINPSKASHKNRHCKNLNTNFNTKLLSPWPWP